MEKEQLSMIKQTLPEWRKEAAERFGNKTGKWAFKCSRCGNIQTPMDFVEKAGMKPDDAASASYQQCIGRHVQGIGCDWAAYGLLGTLGNGRIVITDDGREVEVFDFAEAEEVAAVVDGHERG
ncbi:VVA0879 family protein [Cohnella massiliensis]|uniref:VVA0879 family protein n=1 Tax=Cohnella massiliensis TaxID=1816691 RepID=UPI001FE995FC|nr:VVA0879 family protein [Cohnella massiliensis]